MAILLRGLRTALAAMALGLSVAAAASDHPTPATSAAPGPAAPSAAPPMSTADLSAFFDGLVPQSIQTGDIAGAVVLVVKDGQVIFAKGYGHSDVEADKAVSPADTLFRIGSISKLFTWTAVMQQVEAGKLDLDADINQYLDFRIPARFGKPVTLRDLMTHRPGFEEAISHLISTDPSQARPLADAVRRYHPDLIFEPGSVPAYSNYGAMLAGYIVQRVSGEEFTAYVQAHILQPLDMRHTSFEQPLPAGLAPLMSKGYDTASEKPKPFEIVSMPPAGSASASAADMAHFMLAHLQQGRYGETRILRPETVELMHTRQRAFDPRLNGVCLGFYENSRNGHRIIAHGGDTASFHSDLELIPDANVGYFFAINSAGNDKVKLRSPFFRKFVDRYFPAPAQTVQPLATAAQDATLLAGTYLPSRRSQTNFSYLFTLIGQTTVSTAEGGALTISDLKGENDVPIKLRETAPGLWQDPADPQRKAIFRQDAAGRWQFATDTPIVQYERSPWYRSQTVVLIILGLAMGLPLLSLLFWPVAAMVRRHYGVRLPLNDRQRRALGWTRWSYGLLALYWCFFAGVIAWASADGSNFGSTAFDYWLRATQVAGILAAPVLWLLPRSTKVLGFGSGVWWWTRIHHILLALSALATLVLMVSTHLVTLDLNY